ncbi:hypothetical protein [Marinigracilibium pacificum]|uniref:Uncharacterized protein n=1 Tax=Marinigracilibium pacificum TaxID=2729599 RepID=A0A848J6X5_9BACT|nr:hypothetical protein [Marinigracilibium pacificum]NMM48862.1 hypothetical protein [Marinigracilibium pacificum]
MSPLSYSKLILSKVICYPQVFKKEYKKALKNLNNDDSQKLKEWIHKANNNS